MVGETNTTANSKSSASFHFNNPTFQSLHCQSGKRDGRQLQAGRPTLYLNPPFALTKGLKVDGSNHEFSVDSSDCPYLLKPGQAKRVRSIPFEFNMPRVGLPASFISTHGRAKLEYIISATTLGKRSKDATSTTFRLLPSPTLSTFQTLQHNFNIDIDNGGSTIDSNAPVRNILTVTLASSCPNPTDLISGSSSSSHAPKHHDHVPQ